MATPRVALVESLESPKNRGPALDFILCKSPPDTYPTSQKTPFDRDRGTPRGAAPPTPPGIRVAYHGGSIGLGLQGWAFGYWLRHQWFGPLVTADPGFTPITRFQGQ